VTMALTPLVSMKKRLAQTVRKMNTGRSCNKPRGMEVKMGDTARGSCRSLRVFTQAGFKIYPAATTHPVGGAGGVLAAQDTGAGDDKQEEGA
jgi:hypothetical protein